MSEYCSSGSTRAYVVSYHGARQLTKLIEEKKIRTNMVRSHATPLHTDSFTDSLVIRMYFSVIWFILVILKRMLSSTQWLRPSRHYSISITSLLVLTHSCLLTHSLTHSCLLTHSLTHYYLLPPSHTLSLTYSLAPSFTHSLTHSLTHVYQVTSVRWMAVVSRSTPSPVCW